MRSSVASHSLSMKSWCTVDLGGRSWDSADHWQLLQKDKEDPVELCAAVRN